MKQENSFPYNIIKGEEVGIKDEESTETEFYMGVNLYTISNGSKLGLAYDKNDWNHPARKPLYEVLIECDWDHLDILDTEYGAHIVAYLHGKCCCFSLFGTSVPDEETTDCCRFYISIVPTLIFECLYDSVTYDKHSCERILLCHRENSTQYYDLKTETLSEAYDGIYLLDDEFIECSLNGSIKRINLNGDVIFPELSELEIVLFVCKYKDGRVYRILTNRNCEENLWEGYILFYSETNRTFRATEVYDRVNFLGESDRGRIFQMTGFEGIKNNQINTYNAKEKLWSDSDMSSIKNLRIVR